MYLKPVEVAFTILGMGIVDAVITQILKDSKNQNKVTVLRVSMYVSTALLVIPELLHFMKYAKAVLAGG